MSQNSAEGLWQYQPTVLDEEVVKGNIFWTTTEVGRWTGTFTGGSEEYGQVIVLDNGDWLFQSVVYFREVSVDGKTGTLIMWAAGSKPEENPEWLGKWVIIMGTGELDSLQGKGKWWGPGYSDEVEWGDIFYDGNYQFDSE